MEETLFHKKYLHNCLLSKIFIYTRFPINSSIIGLVAALGETVNIGDNSGDSAKFEDDNHFEHRSLLCMPLR